MVLSPQSTGLDFAGFLKCDVESCAPPLPLFAVWNETMTAEQRGVYAAMWIWGDVKCSKEHPIANPQKKL